MKGRRVLAAKNIPTRLPLLGTVAYSTALHYWGAPEWLWGVFVFLMAFVWVAVIVDMIASTEVELP